MSRAFSKAAIVLAVVCSAFAQQAGTPQIQPPAEGGGRAGRGGGRGPAPTVPPLFFKEEWQRPHNTNGQVPVVPENLTNANLELKVYGPDAKNLTISGVAGQETGPINLWTGMCTAPVMATLRDKNNYVDLSGLAKVRWVTRASAFHVVRPVVKLADGTFLVGDHADSSTTTFNESEFSFYGMRWVKIDPERIVTTGVYGPVGDAASWIEHPDLSKVDEVGFADLMPSTGHGSGGWVNVGRIEVYGKPVKR
jgi:hypothetical protein